jgi:hypothetical protein
VFGMSVRKRNIKENPNLGEFTNAFGKPFLCEKKNYMWGKGQSELGPMITLIGHSIHRMGCVFHLLFYHMLTIILQ